uniref:Phospholipase B-like n=1 Tax=Timema monikensis TaxID=170555 RepID=A0A7R9EF78_9NEOP|nr:unnamed protein product [Timema monikensis]
MHFVQAFSIIFGAYVLLYATYASADSVRFAYVTTADGEYEVSFSDAGSMREMQSEFDWTATLKYENTVNLTGWAVLELETEERYSDEVQAYSAGFLEGFTMADLIYMHWYNTMNGFCEGRTEVCRSVQDHLDKNRGWVDQMVVDYGDHQPYWHQMKLIYRQLDGLHAGVGSSNRSPDFANRWLNIQGDLEDLMEALDTSPGVKLPLVLGGRKGASCSALIKLLDDSSDLYTAQDTWSSLQSMLRVLKKYNFGFHRLGNQNLTLPGRGMSFSSYPGTILSNDDFYITSAGLVTQETTIGNSNASLWSHVKPVGQRTSLNYTKTETGFELEDIRVVCCEIYLLGAGLRIGISSCNDDGRRKTSDKKKESCRKRKKEMFGQDHCDTDGSPGVVVLEFARVLVANRLGHCGRSWSKIFSLYNSGTYNNQWMIVDYNKFKPGTKRSQLKNNLLWVLEQIPGYIKAADKTDVLRNQSYWPSYNAAYFPEVFNLSGVPVLVEKYGDWFTYDRTPRARIFRRDHVKVRDIQSMMSLMRYSDYQHDNLSRCDECTPKQNAENIIACRSDLNPANGTYPFQSLGHRSHVATDSKVTGSSLVLNLQFWAVSGPPHGGSTPVFDWSTSDFGKSTPHLGHPVRWEFPPLLQHWETNNVVNHTAKGR